MSGATKKPRTRWGTGRIAVSAKWPEIAADLKANWPLTMLFEKHMDPAEISYSQFRRQVHRFQAAGAQTSRVAAEPSSTSAEGPPNASSPDSFGKDYDATIDPVRLQRLTGIKPGRK